jgi:hypothetical protein
MFVTISGHKKKDRVFGMTKINKKLKEQSVRNECCSENRNEHQQLEPVGYKIFGLRPASLVTLSIFPRIFFNVYI